MSTYGTIHVTESDGEPEVSSGDSYYKFELEELFRETEQWGVEPEHMDRLTLIARDISIDKANLALAEEAERFALYFEQWGVDSMYFHSLWTQAMNQIGAHTSSSGGSSAN